MLLQWPPFVTEFISELLCISETVHNVSHAMPVIHSSGMWSYCPYGLLYKYRSGEDVSRNFGEEWELASPISVVWRVSGMFSVVVVATAGFQNRFENFLSY